MKKICSSVLTILMILILALTGCGSGPIQNSPAQNNGPAGAAQDGSAPKPSQDSSMTDAAENSGSSAGSGIPAADLKIGVIYIGDPSEGSGYTYTHEQGITAMRDSLGLSDRQIIRKTNVDSADASAIESAMLECIEEGCQVIFATSWGYMDTCEALAAEYPDVIFSHICGYKSNGVNFNNYYGRMYQARYLSGIAAGLQTKTGKIGYVAAWGSDNTEVTAGCNAFAMGVYSVNPEAKVHIRVTNSWYDPEGERQAAQALIDIGCDVIAQHCDSPNPQLAAEEAGVWGIGFNSDMLADAPEAVLTSAVWNWGVYYTETVRSILDGSWSCENYYGGLEDGLVGLTGLADFCEEGTEKASEEAAALLRSGQWDVFTGEIETNTGEIIGTAGQRLDDDTIQNNIHWYFKNIVEQ